MDAVTLDQLRVLATLQRTGSVSATARELHRAQSAVSYALKTLEGALELPLVDHGGYRARLTPVGAAILAKAQDVLTDLDGLARLAEELRGGTEPRLGILLDAVLPTAGVMAVLADLNERQTVTQVNLRVALLGGMVQALEQEAPDLLLAPRHLYNLPPRYEHEVVGSVTMVPVVAAAHPLAAHTTPIPLAALRRHVHLLITSPPGLRTPVDAGLIGAPRHWSFPDFASRLEGLRAGLGFAWMPTHLIADDVARGVLAPLVLERGDVQQNAVTLSYRVQPPLGPTGRSVLSALRKRADLLQPAPEDLLMRYRMT